MFMSSNTHNLISIIVPVFNGELFINRAYNLLVNQNLLDFEIIFIDNNSSDNSINIINEIRNKDNRVSLYFERNQGAASARNKGLKQAKGAFIYFFDVDDELYDEAIKSLLQVLVENEDVDSVFGNMVKSNLALKETQTTSIDTMKLSIPEKYVFGIRWMNYGTLPGTPCFLHRKRVFKKIGNFNSELKLGEDAAFHVKLGMECNVAHLDKKILLYYRHQDSTVSIQNKKQAKEFTYWQPLIKEHIPYLISHKVPIEFKKEVLVRVYGYMPKMLALTNGVLKRSNLKKKLLSEVKSLKIPFFISIFVNLVAVTGSLNLYKFYFFYILKPYKKHLMK